MRTIGLAVAAGIGVLLAGNLPWVAVLAPLNLRFFPSVPWAIVPMAVYLWLYWRYVGGRIGSVPSPETRRINLRANPVPPDAWPVAIITGLLGFGALLSLVAVMARLVTMPEATPINVPTGMPMPTVVLLLIMASIVAGVTEEAGFRGYMQGPIERRYGVGLAILVNGTMFGLLHFWNHPDAVVPMLPYYIAVAAVYGGVTWATNSILPALFLHAGGDVWSLTRLWGTGRPEWQLSAAAPPLVWTSGPDAAFLIAVVSFIGFSVATFAMCRALRTETQHAR